MTSDFKRAVLLLFVLHLGTLHRLSMEKNPFIAKEECIIIQTCKFCKVPYHTFCKLGELMATSILGPPDEEKLKKIPKMTSYIRYVKNVFQ